MKSAIYYLSIFMIILILLSIILVDIQETKSKIFMMINLSSWFLIYIISEKSINEK